MNDQQLTDELRAIHTDPDLTPNADAFLQRVLATSLEPTPQRHGPVSLSLGTRFWSLFSATKFVVAAGVVALFGGLLLVALSTQPSGESLLPPGRLRRHVRL